MKKQIGFITLLLVSSICYSAGTRNKILFYGLDAEQYTYRYFNKLEFSLPDNYQNVFCESIVSIGVVANGEANFYTWRNEMDKWELNKDKKYTLPKDCKQIFGMAINTIGIVTGDQFIMLYSAEKWQEMSRMKLPPNATTVFCSENDGIGVVVNNIVKFYKLDGTTWKEKQGWDFPLPQGYKNVFSGMGPYCVCVFVNGKIEIFQHDKVWKNINEEVITAPVNCVAAFCFGTNRIAFVCENK
jgi:hypothetical protein